MALVLGFLVHLKYFDLVPAYLIMCAGDFFPDSLYYYIGYFGSQKKFLEKYGSRSKLIANHFPIIEKLWHDHPFKTMFLSKIAYGMSTPLLISSGLAKMPYKKFISCAFPVTLLQFAVAMTAGYYLSYSYAHAEKYIKIVGVVIAVVLLVFIFTYIRLQKYAKGQIEKLEEAEELKEKTKI